MVDIFDEVDEDLRADRAGKWLRRYGGLVIAAAVLVVLGAGGWQAWSWYQARENAALAQRYLDAMKVADTKGAGRRDAEAQFSTLAASAGPGYRTLARLREAGLKADAGDLAGASNLWDQVAADGSADLLLRDLANLQWALHHIDGSDGDAVQERLKQLIGLTNPWHALAEEAQAMLDLHRGRPDAARDTLKQLAQDVTAPEGVRRRADGMLGRLGG